MNIHPIFVHFPIALLSVYAILECVRVKRLLERSEWFFLKAALLFLGGLGALAAKETGDFGKTIFLGSEAVIRVHENFADATITIFGILALIYLVSCLDRIWGNCLRRGRYASAWQALVDADRKLLSGPVIVPCALLGFAVLSITGGLGGSIVYGASSDPFTHLVNDLFVR